VATLKERISLTIRKDVLKWVDKNVDDKIFANRSHAFEFLIADEKREEKKKA